jgi:hypothetical protein
MAETLDIHRFIQIPKGFKAAKVKFDWRLQTSSDDNVLVA